MAYSIFFIIYLLNRKYMLQKKIFFCMEYEMTEAVKWTKKATTIHSRVLFVCIMLTFSKIFMRFYQVRFFSLRRRKYNIKAATQQQERKQQMNECSQRESLISIKHISFFSCQPTNFPPPRTNNRKIICIYNL
jgi:hypothetical protein